MTRLNEPEIKALNEKVFKASETSISWKWHMGPKQLFWLAWCSVFKPLRAVYFLHWVDKGMACNYAMDKAKKDSRKDIKTVLYASNYIY